MKWVAYIWRVIVNAFCLAVVGAVLISIQNPMEKSIIAVLGLLYVTVRSHAIGQALSTIAMATSIQTQIDQIRCSVDNTYEVPDRSEELTVIGQTQVKLHIDGFFLALVFLACLAAFFSARA